MLCKARLIAEGAPLRALINAVRLNHEPAALGHHGRAQGCECTASSSDSQGAQEHQVSRLTVQMRSPCAWSSTNSVPAQSGQVCSYLARRPDASAIHAGPLALCANWLAAQAWGPLRKAQAGLLFTTESAQPGPELDTAQAQSGAPTGTTQALAFVSSANTREETSSKLSRPILTFAQYKLAHHPYSQLRKTLHRQGSNP